jgi:xanthine dehydrogenase small subunit
MASIHLKINDIWMDTKDAEGSLVLDYLRGGLGLKGTKEGCREGDCGACAVMLGERDNGIPRYRAVPSCLLALGTLEGKHLLTIEGLTKGAPDSLTPVMRAFLEENASQCGFCSPGFIISLSSWLAEPAKLDLVGAITAVDGNLCRCTGYGAIRRAAEKLVVEFADLPMDPEKRLLSLVERGVLPGSVISFMEETKHASSVENKTVGKIKTVPFPKPVVIGGGTDYYVRNPDPEPGFSPVLLSTKSGRTAIEIVDHKGEAFVEVGAAVTVHDFFSSSLVRSAAPGIEAFEHEFASTLIRNLATVGGNIANASPVGDITSMLMGLGAVLSIGVNPPGSSDNGGTHAGRRLVPIEKFFLGYKAIDLKPGEIIETIQIPARKTFDIGSGPILPFSFEKISKRGNLDIAAVNTAMSFNIVERRFSGVRISAGGVAPIPVLLEKAPSVLEGVPVHAVLDVKTMAGIANAASDAAMREVNPISDVRGSADYRRRMTGKLVLAHFLRFFSRYGIAKEIFP